MPKERRKHPRFKPEPDLRFGCYSHAFDEAGPSRVNFAVKAVDLSPGGCCLVTTGRLRVGLPLQIEITVDKDLSRFRAESVIRWADTLQHQGREAHIAGIQFMRILEVKGKRMAVLDPKGAKKAAGPDPELRRRQHKRVVMSRAEVQCVRKGLGSAFGLAGNVAHCLVDVSEGGCQIVSREKLKEGQSVKLSLRFTGPSASVEAVGEVRWCERNTLSLEPRWPTGIEFRRIPPDDMDRLRTVLRSFAGVSS